MGNEKLRTQIRRKLDTTVDVKNEAGSDPVLVAYCNGMIDASEHVLGLLDLNEEDDP